MPETKKTGRMRFKSRLCYGLAGKNIHLMMDDGYEYVACFLDGGCIAWAKQGEEFINAEYKCVKDSPETFMVSFFADEGGRKTCMTLVFDMQTSLVTMVKAWVGLCPARKDLVTQKIVFGAIKRDGEPLSVIRHGYTNELAGKKIAWQYSPAVKLTHIYLSERYIRSSLKDMPPIDENTTEEQKLEIADRAVRWKRNFFEEECFYIKIRDSQYLVGFIEDFRNRVNPTTGGGDILFLINTVTVRDYTRSFDLNAPEGPRIVLGMAVGEFIDEHDEMEDMPSPYRVQ